MKNDNKVSGRAKSANPNSLIPYEKNSRIHSPEQIAMICDSITEFGFLKPVLVDENKMILAGHGATLAAVELGLDAIPIREITGLTHEQKRGFVIADNRSSELSKWDWELLTLELTDLQSIDMDLKPLGFEDFGGADNTHTRRGTNVTIGGERFLLQLEFEDEKELETVFNEMQGRGVECVILT